MRMIARAAGSKGPIELPPRPYLPPLAALAAGVVASAAMCMETGWRLAVHGGYVWMPLALLGGCLGVAIVRLFLPDRLGTRRYARWALIGMTAGALSSMLGIAQRAASIEKLTGTTMSRVVLTVEGDPSLNTYGTRVDARVSDASGEVLGSVALSTDEPYEAGTMIRAVGRLQALEEDSWDRSRYLSGQVAEVKVVRVLNVGEDAATPLDVLRRRVLEVIDPGASEAAALIAGIVCGRTTELSQTAANDAFATTGTSHLVAVSGSHLALVAALVARLFSATRARPFVRTAVLLVLMGCYVVFTGGAPSAARSLVMVAADLLTRLGGRRAHSLSGLALAVSALVVVQPGVVYDLGFQLSAASVLFIHLFSRYTETLLQTLRLPESIASPLALTLVAQLATLPLTLPVFGELSLIAPLANLLLGPLMTALLVAGLVVAPLAACIPSAGVLVCLPTGLSQICIFTAELFANIPYAAIAVDASVLGAGVWAPYISGAVVYLLWRLPRPRVVLGVGACCCICLVAHIVRIGWFASPRITVLDVGQADAILVRDGASTLLVDAGVDDTVVTALARNEVLHLDAVLITHWDRDHWGGLPAILAVYPVGRIIVAEGAARSLPSELDASSLPPIVEVAQGDELAVGSFRATVVWPGESVNGTENADSVVLDVNYRSEDGQLRMLLTGDTEAPQANQYAPLVGDIDVLKLGHHGSAAATDAEMLRVLAPELSVASAGANNSYGHPSVQTVEEVRTAGSAFLCTIDAGDIVLEPDGVGVRVHTARAA